MSARSPNARLWARDPLDWYVEPEWVSERLFEEEKFSGGVLDPACGIGRIATTATLAGKRVWASDIKKRVPVSGEFECDFVCDFLTQDYADFPVENVVSNPPFNRSKDFALKAISIAERKVAMIFPVRVLNAAGSWLKDTPLYRVWLLTPRPSMPPGAVIQAGEKPGGGTVDFCWLVWLKGYDGEPTIRWLHRDGNQRTGAEHGAGKEQH